MNANPVRGRSLVDFVLLEVGLSVPFWGIGALGRGANGRARNGTAMTAPTADRTSQDLAGSRAIAGIAGPTMVAIGASEALTYRIWASNIAPLIALNGGLLFVAGLAIVRVHNRWTRGWPVLVTLTGWLGIVAGLFRMFAPEAQQAGENAPTTVTTAVVTGAVGLVLTFQAYRGSVRP